MATYDDFSKDFLDNIIVDFSKKKTIFLNEKQFQFELGREIDKRTACEKVWFEYPRSNNNGKREYTDLVVQFKSGEQIGIELKYKLPESMNIGTIGNYKEDIHVPSQGSVDEGCYYFLKDVERLENSNYNKAFAIIIANAPINSKSTFWSKQRKTVWEDFRLTNGNTSKTEVMKWGKGKRENWSPVELKKEYTYNWDDYYEDNEIKMRYMIIEIVKNNQDCE